jgi:hypothetical protein
MHNDHSTMSKSVLVYCLRVNQRLVEERAQSRSLVEANYTVIRLHLLQ